MTTPDPAAHEAQKHEIVGVYDRAAGLYDRVGVRSSTFFADMLVARLNIPAGAQVLDVATGRGELLFAAAQKVGPRGSVIGIDLAPKMIAETAAEIQARGLTQAQVEWMDAEAAQFPDHSFDYVLCGLALHFMDYARALVQFRHMLKPGGYIATTHPYVPDSDAENMQRWQWLFDLTRQVFPAGFVPPASWTAPNRLNRPETITAALEQGGFINISVTREETVMYFSDEQDWWAWEWSQASRFWLEGMSPEALVKFKSISFAKLNAMKGPAGIPIRLGVCLAIAKAPGTVGF